MTLPRSKVLLSLLSLGQRNKNNQFKSHLNRKMRDVATTLRGGEVLFLT